MKETFTKFKITNGTDTYHISSPSLEKALITLGWSKETCKIEELGTEEVEVSK